MQRSKSVSFIAVLAVVLALAAACGGSDGADTAQSSSGGGSGEQQGSASAGGAASVSPAEAEACLDATDFPVDVSDLMAPEAMDALGIDTVLGWDFAQTGFLGSITFYDDVETAVEQHEVFAEMSEAAEAAGVNTAERFGVAVVDMTGGSEEAIAAARTCLTP